MVMRFFKSQYALRTETKRNPVATVHCANLGLHRKLHRFQTAGKNVRLEYTGEDPSHINKYEACFLDGGHKVREEIQKSNQSAPSLLLFQY